MKNSLTWLDLTHAQVQVQSKCGFSVCMLWVMFQSDLSHREVDQDDIEGLCKEHDFLGWSETSVKEGAMVEESMK